jgi:uncharacterized protein
MERESFEDPDIARMMNDTFVCVKVDREERPDIDKVYMTACQILAGNGGWPLSIIMTPDKRPFFATTYIPKEILFGRIGMKELIPNVRKVWTHQRHKVEGMSDRVISVLTETVQEGSGEDLDTTILDDAFHRLSESFDERYGGFGSAPKFPTPEKLNYLLRYWKRTGNERALEMVEETFTSMRRGGVYDQIGYGFHRYSTDRAWILHHFEKMLYDQALVSISYTEAYQATRKEEYAQTVKEILSYVDRVMTSPEGAFYSAEDADSDGVEGRFYLWTIEELLTTKETGAITKAFNIIARGNFEVENQDGENRNDVLHTGRALCEIASETNIALEELDDLLTTASKKLFDRREVRTHPHKDDKILTDWNGLMIAAFAKAAQVFGDGNYERSATRAADFILRNMKDKEGHLFHRFRKGEAAVDAYLDDYAFLIWGLIEIHQSSFHTEFIEEAMALTKTMKEMFWDEEKGGFFFTGVDAEKVIVRKKDSFDGALPSGNSVAALDLLRLYHLTGNLELEKMADLTARSFSREIATMPEPMPSCSALWTLLLVQHWKW